MTESEGGTVKSKKRIDAKFISKEARRLTNAEPGSTEHHFALLMLSSVIVGPNLRRVARFLGKPVDEIRTEGHRLRECGIWRGGRVYGNWFEKNGVLEFNMDVAVAMGYLDAVKQ